jgi:hypothetical protein
MVGTEISKVSRMTSGNCPKSVGLPDTLNPGNTTPPRGQCTPDCYPMAASAKISVARRGLYRHLGLDQTTVILIQRQEGGLGKYLGARFETDRSGRHALLRLNRFDPAQLCVGRDAWLRYRRLYSVRKRLLGHGWSEVLGNPR